MYVSRDRKDMLNIFKHWKNQFLVAELMDGKTSKGIVGTISFREEIKNVNFKGKTLPKETFEIFTLRLVSNIFMTTDLWQIFKSF